MHAKPLRIRAFWSELLDARHATLPVRRSHTLVSAKLVKMLGTRVVELQRRRRRNVELLRIRIHDHWTRVQVRWILSRRGRKRPPWQTLKKRGRPDAMRTTFNEHPLLLIRWNLSMMKTCRRGHEWQETFFISVVRTILKFDVNEEAWPNADLASHSCCEGALIDGLPANKV